MKYWVLMLAMPAMMSKTCKNKKTDSDIANKDSVQSVGIPACVQHKIDSITKLPRWNPPAEVNEYTYKGKRVFLFSSDCCDFYNIAVDASCNYVCAPNGGFTGRGDMKCMDFDSTAKLVKRVWRDERK